MPIDLKRIEVITAGGTGRDRRRIVIFKDSVVSVQAKVTALETLHNIKSIFSFFKCVKGMCAEMPDSVAVKIKADSDITSVEDDLEIQCVGQSLPWGLKRVGALQSPTMNYEGNENFSSVHVFILDTGVDLSNPEFNVVENQLFKPPPLMCSTYPQDLKTDLHGHGTSVAGIIAAKNNPFSIVGICPGASVHNYKVMNENGKGFLSSAVAAVDRIINWMDTNPPADRVVVNMSFTTFTGSEDYTALDFAIKRLVDSYFVPVVVAAGNDASDANYFSPSHCIEALTVGAYNDMNTLCEFSNYGTCVDLLAPGENILTTYKDQKHALVSGTSLAAAHVCGAVCLIKVKDRVKTPLHIKNLLTTYASTSGLANPIIQVQRPQTTGLGLYIREV